MCWKTSFLCYPAALGIGIVLVAWAFPLWAVLGLPPPGAPASPDFAQHVVGQRYFLQEGWHWPLLVAQRLDAPHGTNIALTDSLPLLALVLKPFAALLPSGFQAVTVWLAISWAMQPVAAVFALRGAGEQRLLSAMAVAALASTVPSFLARLPHAALAGHFTLLLMLGLYLRAVHPGRDAARWIACAGLLLPALLLIHPYLMLMAAALLLAIPLTLLVRRSPHWTSALWTALLSLAGTAGLAVLLGYAGAPEGNGFGVYSMNLLAPVWPETSSLLPSVATPLDATGGQYEGIQYLGAGLVLLSAAVLLLAPARFAAAISRHTGLAAACLVLTALALSSRVYAGHTLLLSLPSPSVLGIVRASGRLFWPVTYALLIGGAALLLRAAPQRGPVMLLMLAALQVADSSGLLRLDRERLNRTLAYPFDVAQLRSALAAGRQLDIIPRFPCEATFASISSLMQVIWIGSETGIVTDTAYTARPMPPFECDAREQAARALAAGEVRVLLPGHADLAALVPGGYSLCQRSNEFTICSNQPGQAAE